MTRKVDYRIVDLFCGGGGLSQGITDAGLQIVAAYDWWDAAINFYNHNIHDHTAYKFNLSDVEGAVESISQWQPNIIIGGPPCQDFSSAGKRDDNGGRADLTVAYANIVVNLKPTVFVMENVERALKSKVYQRALGIFKDAGYGLTISVLDASLCGVPQKRKRAVVFGVLGGSDDAVLPIIKRMQSDKPMTMRDFFGDSLGIEYYYRHPRSYARRAIFSIDEPSPTIRGVNRPVPSGYKGHPGDATKISADIRPLTTKERSLIQTFPSEWELVGCKSDVEQIIGNAVPVKLGEFIGKVLNAFVEENNVVLDTNCLTSAPYKYRMPESHPSQGLLPFQLKDVC